MIPVLSLRDFHSSRKNDFVQKLGKTYEEIGFVAIADHGFPFELSDALYQVVESFFALPLEVKKQYERKALFGQRGYTAFGMEHAKDKAEGDLKEFWQFGPELTPNELEELQYPANIFVHELPDFHGLGIKTYSELLRIGRDVLKAIALYLGLEEDYFEEFVLQGNSILRPIHYPPIHGDVGGAVRSAAHEDINLITLLMGASASGLQVKDRNDHWVDVATEKDQLVVNVGDMLQRLTNNKLRSTTHRVINTEEALSGASRFSIPFFLHPISSMPLNCLKECIAPNENPAYEPITAGQYLDERLIEIGLKPA